MKIYVGVLALALVAIFISEANCGWFDGAIDLTDAQKKANDALNDSKKKLLDALNDSKKKTEDTLKDVENAGKIGLQAAQGAVVDGIDEAVKVSEEIGKFSGDKATGVYKFSKSQVEKVKNATVGAYKFASPRLNEIYTESKEKWLNANKMANNVDFDQALAQLLPIIIDKTTSVAQDQCESKCELVINVVLTPGQPMSTGKRMPAGKRVSTRKQASGKRMSTRKQASGKRMSSRQQEVEEATIGVCPLLCNAAIAKIKDYIGL